MDFISTSRGSGGNSFTTPDTPTSRRSSGMGESTQQQPQSLSCSKKNNSNSCRDKILVCVRIRPLNDRENKMGSSSPVWRTTNNSLYQCNPKTGAANPHSTVYSFDHVYDSGASSQLIYSEVAQNIVQSAVQGYNGTIFAYGQTSSGKTHTMKGTAQEAGIIPQSVYEVFETICRTVDREFVVRVSYLEIYNENILDLLEPENKNLKIHEDLERGIFVGNLKEEPVMSPEQVLELMDRGERHRHFGTTNMNHYSSRSHTIFRLVIESRRRTGPHNTDGEDLQEDATAVRVATLNLVDLAGSERVRHTGADGQRLLEGSHINKSLLTLGTVIGKLSEGSPHIPYRDSKLTRILQTALGGNSRTAIICTITPAEAHSEETHSTLKFANRAKSITNQAHINEIINDQNLMQKLKREAGEWKQRYNDQLDICEQLTKENNQLLASIDEYKGQIITLQSQMDQLNQQRMDEQQEAALMLKQLQDQIEQIKEQRNSEQNEIYEMKELHRRELEQNEHFQQEINSKSVQVQQQMEHLNHQREIDQQEIGKLNSQIKQLQEELAQKDSDISSMKLQYENMLEQERLTFDSLSHEQLQKCLELDNQMEEARKHALKTISELENEKVEELDAQADTFEKIKLDMLDAFAREKADLERQYQETEKELQARIDELEQEKSEFVVDNTGTYEKVNALQRDMNALKNENEQLRLKLQKRTRRRAKKLDEQPQRPAKRACLGVLQENVLNNTTNESNKENTLVAPSS